MNLTSLSDRGINIISTFLQKIIMGIDKHLWKYAEKSSQYIINGHIDDMLVKKANNIHNESIDEGFNQIYRKIIDKLYLLGVSSLMIACMVCAATTSNQMRVLVGNFYNADERDFDDYRAFFQKLGVQSVVMFFLYKSLSKLYPHLLNALSNVVGRQQINKTYINRIFDVHNGKLYPRRKEKFIIIRDKETKENYICWKSGKWYPKIPIHLFSADVVKEIPKLVGEF